MKLACRAVSSISSMARMTRSTRFSTAPGISAVSFVGSVNTAKYIYRRAAEKGKRVQALGGAKNYMVVMPDAVVDKTVSNVLGSAFGNAGQRCMAGSVLVTVGLGAMKPSWAT